MKRILFLMLAVYFSISAFAEERIPPSAYSNLLVDGTYGYRKLVFVTNDPLSQLNNYVFECVSDSTENASHMFYELVIAGVYDKRYSSSSTTLHLDGEISYHYIRDNRNIHQGQGYIDIFLGFTKDQALDFFEELDRIKETRPLRLTKVFKGDFSEKIYRFFGHNNNFVPAAPKEEKDDVYVRYVRTENNGKALIEGTTKFFLFRTRYSDKSYIEAGTVDSYIKAIKDYQGEAADKAKCVSTDINKVVDFSGVCNYEKLATRKKGFNWQLSEFQIYYADNPQYEDERYQGIKWGYNTCDVFPIGKNVEDANSIIDAMEEAVDYAYKNKMGWFKKKQIIKHLLHNPEDERFPDYFKTIGDVDYRIEGYTREKLANFHTSRLGGCDVVLSRTTLEEIRHAVNDHGK